MIDIPHEGVGYGTIEGAGEEQYRLNDMSSGIIFFGILETIPGAYEMDVYVNGELKHECWGGYPMTGGAAGQVYCPGGGDVVFHVKNYGDHDGTAYRIGWGHGDIDGNSSHWEYVPGGTASQGLQTEPATSYRPNSGIYSSIVRDSEVDGIYTDSGPGLMQGALSQWFGDPIYGIEGIGSFVDEDMIQITVVHTATPPLALYLPLGSRGVRVRTSYPEIQLLDVRLIAEPVPATAELINQEYMSLYNFNTYTWGYKALNDYTTNLEINWPIYKYSGTVTGSAGGLDVDLTGVACELRASVRTSDGSGTVEGLGWHRIATSSFAFSEGIHSLSISNFSVRDIPDISLLNNPDRFQLSVTFWMDLEEIVSRLSGADVPPEGTSAAIRIGSYFPNPGDWSSIGGSIWVYRHTRTFPNQNRYMGFGLWETLWAKGGPETYMTREGGWNPIGKPFNGYIWDYPWTMRTKLKMPDGSYLVSRNVQDDDEIFSDNFLAIPCRPLKMKMPDGSWRIVDYMADPADDPQ